MLKHWRDGVITCCGIGRFPVAPGTAASLAAIPVYYFLCKDAGTLVYLLLLSILFIVGIICIDSSGQGHKDPSYIVIDEVCGVGVAFFKLNDIMIILLAFVLFRFFDIFKPFPINYIDKKIKNGFGVMLDDIAAGICTSAVIYGSISIKNIF